MTLMKELIDTFFEEKRGFTSNRMKLSRRSRQDRRYRCVPDRIYERRSGEERRTESERRKRWKRVGKWGAEVDHESYLKGYHVS